jgi:hypothetical protein
LIQWRAMDIECRAFPQTLHSTIKTARPQGTICRRTEAVSYWAWTDAFYPVLGIQEAPDVGPYRRLWDLGRAGVLIPVDRSGRGALRASSECETGRAPRTTEVSDAQIGLAQVVRSIARDGERFLAPRRSTVARSQQNR